MTTVVQVVKRGGGTVAVVLLVALAAMGCDDERTIEHPEPDDAWAMAHSVAPDDDDVVAEVDGTPIGVQDVEAAWRNMPHKSVEEVVERVVEREILAARARDEGYHERGEVEFARRQGMVSALLLEEVEKPAEVDEEERASQLERVMGLRRAPEGLRASHLVVLVPEQLEGDDGEEVELDDDERQALFNQALDYVDQAKQLLGDRVDNDALRDVAEQLNEEVLPDEFEATVNEHMRFPRAGEEFDPNQLPGGWVPVVPEFAEGAETVADNDPPGEVLSEPVKTSFGWHLIRIDEVFEAREVDEEAAKLHVEHELKTEARKQLLQQKLEGWAAGVSVQLYPERLGSPIDE